ncbi:unnamed protein product [Phytophthora fragariaefolia]|uniref:Unnamed protein product n=1 Tax=Phytophthora fragariaefolia TaxID=1490495 RepID=A0A9W6YHY4_9STRA|nr:unnamed protein product [Phytophthora fragariaefolia]
MSRVRNGTATADENMVVGNTCVKFTEPEVENEPIESETLLPFRLRTFARSMIYRIVLEEEEARGAPYCQVCRNPVAAVTNDKRQPVDPVPYKREQKEARARELTTDAAGTLTDHTTMLLIRRILEQYDTEAPTIRAKRLKQLPWYKCHWKRVLCSVGGLEAISVGYVEDLPPELHIDSGAVASLIDARVLKRLGFSNAPIRPYTRSRKDFSVSDLRIKGEIELSLRLGILTKLRTFVVVDRLHVRAILGTDALKAFRTVIDLDENVLALKDSGEVFPLEPPRVEEMYATRVASAIRLCPGGLALILADVMGKASDETTVLIEGLPELDPNVKIARTLRTVRDVPESASDSMTGGKSVPERDLGSRAERSNGDSAWGNAVLSAVTKMTAPSRDPMPGLDEARKADLDVDFRTLSLMAKFSIDTGTHAPVKQRPYRVSQAEGDVMEAEMQQYLELGLTRLSTGPWASQVLMIRKSDGGIRFCIDYRRLNAVTIKDCYPLSRIDGILDVLAGAKLFSTIDIASGY